MLRLRGIPRKFPFIGSLIKPLLGATATLNGGPLGKVFMAMVAFLRRIGFLSSPNKFVLTIGDEGATLVSFVRGSVTDAIFVSTDAEDGMESLRDILIADSWAEITVSADVLEQMYREEQLPRVSRWDRFNIIRRRLEVAFPHDPLRSAFTLDRGRGPAASIQFTALPTTVTIERWIAFLEALPNPVIGFCLLPLDSEGLAARLAPPPGEDEPRKVWHALVSQQVTSGFRQIFETDGHLVVTRLTQRPPGELTANATALLIERELRSSISYIKRLGYSEGDRLDLVVLADADVCAAVAERELPITNLTAMTPRNAGERLGLGAIGPEDGPFSDLLHAANLLFKRRPRTTLATEPLKARLRIELAFKASFVMASAMILLTSFYLASILYDAYDTFTTAQALEQSIANEVQSQAILREKFAKFDVPYDDVASIAQADGILRAAQIHPTEILNALATVLEADVRVQKLRFTARPSVALVESTPPAPGARGQKKSDDSPYQLQITLHFLGGSISQIDQSVAEARRYKDILAKALPSFEVTLVKLPFSSLGTEILSGNVGSAGPLQPGRDLPAAAADYLIRKRA